MLILSFLTIFPTWVMFHYSPLNTRHSLPEGYFIQALFADMQVALSIASSTTSSPAKHDDKTPKSLPHIL